MYHFAFYQIQGFNSNKFLTHAEKKENHFLFANFTRREKKKRKVKQKLLNNKCLHLFNDLSTDVKTTLFQFSSKVDQNNENPGL